VWVCVRVGRRREVEESLIRKDYEGEVGGAGRTRNAKTGFASLPGTVPLTMGVQRERGGLQGSRF
jgi:hypothetical protein